MGVAASQSQPIHAVIVIYDGECGFCSKAIQFILKHERSPELMFCARQSELAREILSQRSFDLSQLDSIALIEAQHVSLYSDASLRLAKYLRAPWSWLQLGLIVPRPVRDPIYKLIARNRKRLSSGGSCQSEMSAKMRERFLC